MSPSDLNSLISDSLLVDAHCHGCDYTDLRSLFNSLEKDGILCLSSATDPESIRTGAELNRRCPRLLNAAGIHPWQAGRFGPSDLERLTPFYREAPQISEIGMDGVWAEPEADLKRQEALFLAQLRLACRYEKPVTLHTKGMEGEILKILKSSMPPSVLIHWFDGDDTALKAFIDMGCFFSISPALICGSRQREICLRIPPEKLLPETDNPSSWPWLFASAAKAGQIREVYSAMAALLELPSELLRRLFKRNCRAFLLP